MRFIRLNAFVSLTLAMVWLVLSGVAAAADVSALSPDEQAFVNRAMADDAAQIAMAQIALRKSTNPRVIALANTIINDRTALDTRLAQVLTQSNAAKSTIATNPVDPTLAGLQTLNGDAFDKTFVGLLVKNHYHAISAYETLKVTCTHSGLQAVAHDAIPDLQGNLAVALDVLRAENWNASARQNALTAVDPRGAKVPVYWESMSIVAAPW